MKGGIRGRHSHLGPQPIAVCPNSGEECGRVCECSGEKGPQIAHPSRNSDENQLLTRVGCNARVGCKGLCILPISDWYTLMGS